MPYPPTRKLAKGLTRSNTRITILEWCERKYYLNYYTFALKDSHPDVRTETLILKGLKSLEMRIGEKSHYFLSDYLHLLKKTIADGQIAIPTANITLLKEQIKTEMENEFNQSKTRDYTNHTDFYGKFGLSEHYYGENLDDQLPSAIEKVITNLDRFIDSIRCEKVKDYLQTAKLVYIEQPRVPNFEMMRVNVSSLPGLQQISVLASPDFGVIFSDTDYLLLDRKSGKEDVLSEGISNQLKVYALKMLLKKGLTSLNGIRMEAYEIFLNTMNTHGGNIAQADIESIIAKIKKDVDYQKQFLINQNPIQNIPLDFFAFRKTSSERKCESCTFRAVCKKLR